MRILAIESSCDETAAAVVENGETVLSSVVASQMVTHGKYGGVVPELASREHLRAIVPVVREALETAQTQLGDLAAIAATVGPGLVGSLLVGVTYAKSLSFATGVLYSLFLYIGRFLHTRRREDLARRDKEISERERKLAEREAGGGPGRAAEAAGQSDTAPPAAGNEQTPPGPRTWRARFSRFFDPDR